MDEASRKKLEQPEGPWERSLHTRLLNKLARHDAAGVVFDVIFDTPSTNPAVDIALVDAIRAHGRVVLAAKLRPVTGRSAVEAVRAVELIRSAAPWGLAEFNEETDGTIRRQFYDRDYTNLAWQAAALINQSPPNRAAERWINFYARQQPIPQGQLPHRAGER